MDPVRRQVTDRSLLGLLEVIELFRLMEREVPAQVISTFLYVATHDKCHKVALEEDLELSTASASRNTDWLSTHHRLGKPGLGLIEKVYDPSNRRRLQLALTPRGKTLVKRIKEQLDV